MACTDELCTLLYLCYFNKLSLVKDVLYSGYLPQKSYIPQSADLSVIRVTLWIYNLLYTDKSIIFLLLVNLKCTRAICKIRSSKLLYKNLEFYSNHILHLIINHFSHSCHHYTLKYLSATTSLRQPVFQRK